MTAKTRDPYAASPATFQAQKALPRLTVKIDTTNHAFYSQEEERIAGDYPHDPGPELARILRGLADDLEHDSGWTYRPLRDAFGNTVGKAELT